ncbi:methyltransferase FkbM family protein [Nostoc carneum NIES-2107]|nr:methyltransferase FkbM family protein [Nostoc carneum NIES-2107]
MNIKHIVWKLQRRIKLYLWQIICWIQPNTIKTFTLIDGSRFDYSLKSALGQALFIQSFETSEIEFVRQSLKKGDIFLDVGANGGLYTVIAAKQIGHTGHVYAFEPGLRELSLLRHNIAVNNLSNVTVIEKAVSNQKGKTQFAISHDGAMNSFKVTNHPQQKIKEWQTVEIISLDDFIQEFNVGKINFIKIDVEGAEHLVLEGAKNILSHHKMIILFEAAEINAASFGYSVHNFLQELINLGLTIYYLNPSGDLVNVDEHNDEIGKKIYNFIAYN